MNCHMPELTKGYIDTYVWSDVDTGDEPSGKEEYVPAHDILLKLRPREINDLITIERGKGLATAADCQTFRIHPMKLAILVSSFIERAKRSVERSDEIIAAKKLLDSFSPEFSEQHWVDRAGREITYGLLINTFRQKFEEWIETNETTRK
jgi:transcription termination factor Rho